MEVKLEVAVDVINEVIQNQKMNIVRFLICSLLIICYLPFHAQSNKDSISIYKKRVLESIEVDFLSSYYQQSGDNAAVSGGIGTEKLNDVTGTIIVSVPLNYNDVLTIDAGISAYSSASSGNIDPFDSRKRTSILASPFQASSGASNSDIWYNVSGSFSRSSDDRNKIWSAKASFSNEYDYTSIGFGGSFAKLFNEKNTEVSFHGNVYLDKWRAIYPIELRPFANGGEGLNNRLFSGNTITGNTSYNPSFDRFANEGRNSYSLGLGLSQILHRNLQGTVELDLVRQNGLLSTPFQRVYFADVADAFIQDFQLADDIERLPDSRLKLAIGGRLNWFVNEYLTMKSYYRYYFDDWGILSHTFKIEPAVKISQRFTIYPSYRFYNQTAANYFNIYEKAMSTDLFYTSDYDLSKYHANQIGLGVSYTDIFTNNHIWRFGLKSIDLKFYNYNRNTTFTSSIITAGCKFVLD